MSGARMLVVAMAALTGSWLLPDPAEANHKGVPHIYGRPPRTGSHYQDHRGDHYQDHRQGEQSNFGGAASSGTRIKCIIFCGNSFTPKGPSHYQDHRNDAPHYQDHRNEGRPIVDGSGRRVVRKLRR